MGTGHGAGRPVRGAGGRRRPLSHPHPRGRGHGGRARHGRRLPRHPALGESAARPTRHLPPARGARKRARLGSALARHRRALRARERTRPRRPRRCAVRAEPRRLPLVPRATLRTSSKRSPPGRAPYWCPSRTDPAAGGAWVHAPQRGGAQLPVSRTRRSRGRGGGVSWTPNHPRRRIAQRSPTTASTGSVPA